MQPFTYYRATSLADGTTVVDLMRVGVLRPSTIVDIGGLRELQGFGVGAERFRSGALAHTAEIARQSALLRQAPVLAQSLALAASLQVRNMATLGSNIIQRTRCARSPAHEAGDADGHSARVIKLQAGPKDPVWQSPVGGIDGSFSRFSEALRSSPQHTVVG